MFDFSSFSFEILSQRRAIEIDEEEDDKNVLSVPSQELNAAISELSLKLENLRTCNDLISKNGRALQTVLSELENGDDLASKTKLVAERATLFRISSNAMINVSLFCCCLSSCVREKCAHVLNIPRDKVLGYIYILVWYI